MALSPFVYWGQTTSTLTLRVDLKRTENPVIELSERKLSFSGEGFGARGQCQYLFHIDFFDEVNPSESFYKVIDRDIEFVLKKMESKTWPRLLDAQTKPAWLKVDFEKMLDDDSDEDADDDKNNMDCENEVHDWRRMPNLMRNVNHKFKRDKDFGRSRKRSMTPEEFRKVYLFLYNLFQCVGFSYIAMVLGIRYLVPESESDMSDSYDVISNTMKFLHLLKLLEILHPLLGYTTHGDVLFPLIDIGYHMFLLFVVIDVEPLMHSRPVTFHLFLVWSLTHVIRHAYYMMRVFDVETLITWIHYTAWFILYPLAFLCEGTLMLFSIPLFEESQRLSFHLPDFFDMKFSMPFVLRCFLLILFFPTFCMKMTRMYKKRKYRLRKKKED